MEGILNINKPPGVTSFRVVAIVRRLSGERRVGHTGTLDPEATGVLPVCLGQATRITEFLVDTPKTYRAVIELGTATDTYDASGNITRESDISDIDRGKIEACLNTFRGTIRQTPPMFSALKHRGQPLYRLARAGVTIERKPRLVNVHRLEIIDWNPPRVTVEVECGKGTYIRSLAHDLGEALGCGAHLSRLERTRCGIFDIRDAVTVPDLEAAFQNGETDRFLHPVDSVLGHLEAVTVDETQETVIKTGQPLWLEAKPGTAMGSPRYCRAYSRDGRFLGILRSGSEPGWWRPKKVFTQSNAP